MLSRSSVNFDQNLAKFRNFPYLPSSLGQLVISSVVQTSTVKFKAFLSYDAVFDSRLKFHDFYLNYFLLFWTFLAVIEVNLSVKKSTSKIVCLIWGRLNLSLINNLNIIYRIWKNNRQKVVKNQKCRHFLPTFFYPDEVLEKFQNPLSSAALRLFCMIARREPPWEHEITCEDAKQNNPNIRPIRKRVTSARTNGRPRSWVA